MDVQLCSRVSASLPAVGSLWRGGGVVKALVDCQLKNNNNFAASQRRLAHRETFYDDQDFHFCFFIIREGCAKVLFLDDDLDHDLDDDLDNDLDDDLDDDLDHHLDDDLDDDPDGIDVPVELSGQLHDENPPFLFVNAILQGDQLNMAVFFWYLVKSDLPAVHATGPWWIIYFNKGTRKHVHA